MYMSHIISRKYIYYYSARFLPTLTRYLLAILMEFRGQRSVESNSLADPLSLVVYVTSLIGLHSFFRISVRLPSKSLSYRHFLFFKQICYSAAKISISFESNPGYLIIKSFFVRFIHSVSITHIP